MCTKAYTNIPTYTCTYIHVFITLIMDIKRHLVKYDLVNLLQNIHNSTFYKIMMKSRAFIFSDDQYGFYDFAVFGRAVLWFVLCYSHDRSIQIHVLQK